MNIHLTVKNEHYDQHSKKGKKTKYHLWSVFDGASCNSVVDGFHNFFDQLFLEVDEFINATLEHGAIHIVFINQFCCVFVSCVLRI